MKRTAALLVLLGTFGLAAGCAEEQEGLMEPGAERPAAMPGPGGQAEQGGAIEPGREPGSAEER